MTSTTESELLPLGTYDLLKAEIAEKDKEIEKLKAEIVRLKEFEWMYKELSK